MEGYQRIAEAFRLLAFLPPELLGPFEVACINAHAKQEKNRRAAEKLAKLGPQQAAESEQCCRATIYNRAKTQRRKHVEPA
jgi:hypothetical protein